MIEYNEETCVTAGALREVGVPIPENVPDCAWVPRWSFRPEVVQGSAHDDGQGRMSIGIAVRFDEPFRWVEGTFQVGGEG
jgi:hypothetical protein